MIDPVQDTLRRWRQSRFVYGQADCVLSVADYAVICGAHDPTAAFRGIYDTEEGAQALIDAHGGLSGLLDLLMLERIDPADAEHGDIVVAEGAAALGGIDLAGLINGDRLTARAERGVVEIALKFVNVTHAWKVGR